MYCRVVVVLPLFYSSFGIYLRCVFYLWRIERLRNPLNLKSQKGLCQYLALEIAHLWLLPILVNIDSEFLSY